MAAVYEAVGVRNGGDLGLFMATVGLVFSVVSGVFYVNIALRRGWVRTAERGQLITGLEDRHHPRQIALGRVRPEVLDPLVFQVLILSAAFGIGWLMHDSVRRITESLASTSASEETSPAAGAVAQTSQTQAAEAVLKSKTTLVATLGDFPLFIYTLFGGMFVRQLMSVCRIDDLIDTLSIQRLSGAAMEFLVVSAIASLRIEAVFSLVTPLIILLAAAFAWTGFCLLHVSPRLLPNDYWFELGIINYGMSTGTTATGFTLLKMVDKELESGAAEDYALAAPLSSPFVGGGMLTVGLPLLILERIPISVSALGLTAVVIGLYVLGRHLARQANTARV
jgi:ESS family glutamate:Na+ symporter